MNQREKDTARKKRKQSRRRGLRKKYILLNIMHLAALCLLLLTVNAAVVSERIQPFYDWIAETPLEHFGQYVIGFVNKKDLQVRRWLKDVPLVGEEADAHAVLVQRIVETHPTHIVRLEDGSVRFGSLTSVEGQDGIWRFKTSAGKELATELLHADDIAEKQVIQYPPVNLSSRDIRFLLEYPELNPYYLPPYVIAAEVPFEQVYLAWSVLSGLSGEFFVEFQSVMEEYTDEMVYVCMLGNETDYLRYALQRGSSHLNLEKSSGYYSPADECLFVYDRQHSLQRYSLENRIEFMETRAKQSADRETQRQIGELADRTRRQLASYLQKDFVETLRHEGAHQLAYRFGVHSEKGFENMWLVEGLAQYCETLPPGAVKRESMLLLKQAEAEGKLIPWPDLVEVTSAEGFGVFGDRISLAYAQSWFMFRFLMNSLRREFLFDYMRKVRKLTPKELGVPRPALFSETIGIPLLKLGWEMNREIREMPPAQTAVSTLPPAD